MIHHKINPSRLERWLKLAYLTVRGWCRENWLYGAVLIANIAWLYLFWFGLMEMGR